jgi:hypothetical protein
MFNFLSKFLQLRKLRRYKENIKFKEMIWQQLKPNLLLSNKLKQEKKEIQVEGNKIVLPAWSKLLLVLLFINFTALEIFIGWVTVQSFSLAFATGGSPDFTPLVTLISLVVGETISYGIYSAKSKAENVEGGIVHDTAMYKLQNQNNEEEDAEG